MGFVLADRKKTLFCLFCLSCCRELFQMHQAAPACATWSSSLLVTLNHSSEMWGVFC